MNKMTKLCKNCFRRDICGNSRTTWCTGYAPYVETRWFADDIKTPPFTNGQKKVIQATEKLGKICNVDEDM